MTSVRGARNQGSLNIVGKRDAWKRPDGRWLVCGRKREDARFPRRSGQPSADRGRPRGGHPDNFINASTIALPGVQRREINQFPRLVIRAAATKPTSPVTGRETFEREGKEFFVFAHKLLGLGGRCSCSIAGHGGRRTRRRRRGGRR